MIQPSTTSDNLLRQSSSVFPVAGCPDSLQLRYFTIIRLFLVNNFISGSGQCGFYIFNKHKKPLKVPILVIILSFLLLFVKMQLYQVKLPQDRLTCMKYQGLREIYSYDEDFETIEDIERRKP